MIIRIAVLAWESLEHLALAVATLGLIPLSLWGWADDWLNGKGRS